MKKSFKAHPLAASVIGKYHRLCQCGLHAVFWWHIGTLMHRLAAERCSTAGLLFPSVSLWNDLANPVFDGV